MTVNQLIEVLKEHDPEMPVVISGYEDGYEHFVIREYRMVHKPDNPNCYGEFMTTDDPEADKMLCLTRVLRD